MTSLSSQAICVSVRQMGDRLNIGYSSAKLLIAQNRIRSIRCGRRVLVPVAEIDAYVAALLAENAAAKG